MDAAYVCKIVQLGKPVLQVNVVQLSLAAHASLLLSLILTRDPDSYNQGIGSKVVVRAESWLAALTAWERLFPTTSWPRRVWTVSSGLDHVSRAQTEVAR